MNGDDMRDLSGSQLFAAPRGLEEIVVSFGDIYNISAGWEPRSAVAGRLSHQRGYSLLFAPGVESVAAGEPDDLSQADGRSLCLGLRRGAGADSSRRLSVSVDALRFVSNERGPNSPPTVGELRLI
jgi:hypothetical protein